MGGGAGKVPLVPKTKLFEKVFSQEFRNLKLFFKNSRFSIFFKSIVPAFFENVGLLAQKHGS